MRQDRKFEVAVVVALFGVVGYMAAHIANAESPKSQAARAIQTGYYGAPSSECPEVGDGTCIPLGIGAPAAALVSAYFDVPDTRGSFRVDLGDVAPPTASVALECSDNNAGTDGRCVYVVVCNEGEDMVAVTFDGWGPVLLTASGTARACFDTRTVAPYVEGGFEIDNSTGCTTNHDCGGSAAAIAVLAVDNG